MKAGIANPPSTDQGTGAIVIFHSPISLIPLDFSGTVVIPKKAKRKVVFKNAIPEDLVNAPVKTVNEYLEQFLADAVKRTSQEFCKWNLDYDINDAMRYLKQLLDGGDQGSGSEAVSLAEPN